MFQIDEVCLCRQGHGLQKTEVLIRKQPKNGGGNTDIQGNHQVEIR